MQSSAQKALATRGSLNGTSSPPPLRATTSSVLLLRGRLMLVLLPASTTVIAATITVTATTHLNFINHNFAISDRRGEVSRLEITLCSNSQKFDRVSICFYTVEEKQISICLKHFRTFPSSFTLFFVLTSLYIGNLHLTPSAN